MQLCQLEFKFLKNLKIEISPWGFTFGFSRLIQSVDLYFVKSMAKIKLFIDPQKSL